MYTFLITLVYENEGKFHYVSQIYHCPFKHPKLSDLVDLQKDGGRIISCIKTVNEKGETRAFDFDASYLPIHRESIGHDKTRSD